MKCPKCNNYCRLKMTGAICLNAKCNWYTHNIDDLKIIKSEVINSAIGKKFRELEIEEIYNDLSEFEGI